jgi:3-phosphoshikimate 1-carboxyvinyltransferase
VAGAGIRVPGDKSITHRALLLAALSSGRCRLGGALASRDTRATATSLRALGIAVGPLSPGRAVRVTGGGLRPFRAPGRTLDCRNSGTTARLLLGLLAGHPFEAALTGDRSLRRRPMARITEPLRLMGASISATDGERLPARIRGGPLRALTWSSPVASAQVKTALFFAGLTGGVPVTVTEPYHSRDHAERLLRLLGVRVDVDGTTTVVRPPEAIAPFDGDVPGDYSSAAYLLAAGVLARSGEVALEGVGINPTRTGFARVLERMGARIEVQGRWMSLGEPAATLVARPAALRATEVHPDEVASLVDEVPLLACLAARAEGTSVFRGVGELRVKESDRLALVAADLAGLGVEARAEDDTLWVTGTDRPLRGRVVTARDHRLAMAFAVLGTAPGGELELDDVRCVDVSYPGFFHDLQRALGGG